MDVENPEIPNQVSNKRNLLGRLRVFLRSQRIVTRIKGPRYHRSRKSIELDITYLCSLKCHNCNRSIGRAPSSDKITLDGIKRFVQESLDKKHLWQRIRILGGEPTMHPDIVDICNTLVDYKQLHCPDTQIQLFTNGKSRHTKKILPQIPSQIEIANSEKTSSSNDFIPFNLAPRDETVNRFTDFSNGCPLMQYVGMGLTPYGYYACPVHGSIDRVIGLDIGRKELPSDDDDMTDHTHAFCGYCGFFRGGDTTTKEQTISRSWETAYANYSKSRPKMTCY